MSCSNLSFVQSACWDNSILQNQGEKGRMTKHHNFLDNKVCVYYKCVMYRGLLSALSSVSTAAVVSYSCLFSCKSCHILQSCLCKLGHPLQTQCSYRKMLEVVKWTF
ncbi:hypothetical protein SKAU_G00354400 [Synaphobranchus kaupii]|uniref:Uncharacterized protein n=1 Tax=Synaphobranchus kaupii TaxID=118154 RepID=A0A9Q1IGG5_SYNKA|nr:hypothetical protein SKAU_G00354400 [Synaphobranchus kaupii]